jgi:hypothetical protein
VVRGTHLGKEKHMENETVWSHFYNRERKPMATVCYINCLRGTAIGISICSERDRPCKATGRSISFQRAKYAAENLPCQGDQPGSLIGHSDSIVDRTDALYTLFGTDLGFGAFSDRYAKSEGVYKIFYVNEPNFRFKRLSFPKETAGAA